MAREENVVDTRAIVKSRIGILLGLAFEKARSDVKLSHRYVFLARKLGMRHNVQLPQEFKRWICKKCLTPLVPGVNCVARVSKTGGGARIIKCGSCGTQKRLVLGNKKH